MELDRGQRNIPYDSQAPVEDEELTDTPLPKKAIKILDELKLSCRGSKFAFPGDRSASGRLMSLGRAPKRIRERVVFEERWCFHDLRRTLETHMARIGVALHVIDRITGHH